MSQPVTWGLPHAERADAARNRRLLLATAREIIAEQGADTLTMDGLAERAGLGKGTVYRRFGTRAGIFQAILDDDERAFQEQVLSGPPPLGPGAEPVDRLIAYGRARIDFLIGHRQIARSALGGREPLPAGSQTPMSRVHIRFLLGQMRLGPADLEVLATQLTAALDGPLLLYLSSETLIQTAPQVSERLGQGWKDLIRRVSRPLSFDSDRRPPGTCIARRHAGRPQPLCPPQPTEVTMSSGRDYDVIVLGGGAPGEHCAGALAARGLRVALVERELVGGECSYWACVPSKSLLRPGEAVQGAREAGATAQVDVQAALAWRDFMVSNYSDAGQERWLASRGIALLRGTGRLAGTGVVDVGGVRHTAEHIVVATGSEPIVPAIPGLRELEGVWGTREATSMKAVPRRLLVLGGGSAGIELAQVVRRLGGEAVLVEGADHVLPREPAPLGQALGEALRRDGIELMLGMHATAARREDDEFVLQFDGGKELRGDRLLVATGRRPRVEGIGLETVGVEAGPRGIPVDEHLRAGERLWAIGDVNGIWPLTHVGEYEGDVVAENIAGDGRPANYEAVPRVTYTDPQAAAVGAVEAAYSATAAVAEVPKTATYTHAYAESNGFLTLLSDGERLTGAYALGPEAGEWMQQATLAIRAHVPVEVLGDTIQPFPSFSGIYDVAVMALRMEIADKPRPTRPMNAQMASLSE